MKIERHPFQVSRLEKGYANAREEVADTLPSARVRASSLTLLIDACSNLIYCGSVVDPEAPGLGETVHIASQASAALMAMGIADGAAVTVPLGPGEPVTYAPGKVDESSLNARRWLEGFRFATICRDTASLKVLCSVPVARLRASTTKSPEYRYLLIEALQSWRKNGRTRSIYSSTR